MDILIILACVPLYVINSFCDKHISTKNGNKYNYIYNFLKFVIVALCFLPMFLIDKAEKFGLGAIICGAACGVMYAISKIVMLKGYEKSSVAFITLCHGAGMLIPCVLGHFFWGEKMSVWSCIGILLTIVSIVFLKGADQEHKAIRASGVLIGIIVFLTSGGIMIAQKLMGLYFKGQSVVAYNFYAFVVAFAVLGVFVAVKPKVKCDGQNDPQKDRKVILLCAGASAVCLCLINWVMTTLAGKVPSVVLFPLFNGLGIVCVCIGSAFVFKEKLTVKRILGLVLGVVGLCLVNIR